MSNAGMSRPARLRYDTIAIGLHWLIAAFILLNIAIGLSLDDLPKGPEKMAVLDFHKSVGVTVLGLSLLRLVWRLMHPFLPLPADMPAPMKLAARGAHVLLYVLMIGLPLSGLLLTSAAGRHFPYFGLFDFPLIGGFGGMDGPARKALTGGFDATHVFLAWSMIVVLVLHILAALYHGFVRKDGVLGRMLPWGLG